MAEEAVLELGFEDDIDYENGTIKNPKEVEKKKEGVDGPDILADIQKNMIDPPAMEDLSYVLPPIPEEVIKARRWQREKKMAIEEKRSIQDPTSILGPSSQILESKIRNSST